MKKTQNILLTQYAVSIAATAIIVALFETRVLTEGMLAHDTTSGYITATVLEILTICSLPLALKLFRLRRVRTSLEGGKPQTLLHWGTVRLMLICIPMLLNAIAYYTFLNVAFFYLAVICLLCLTFVYPSATRCAAETTKSEA